jgi:hypothetical protein
VETLRLSLDDSQTLANAAMAVRLSAGAP